MNCRLRGVCWHGKKHMTDILKKCYRQAMLYAATILLFTSVMVFAFLLLFNKCLDKNCIEWKEIVVVGTVCLFVLFVLLLWLHFVSEAMYIIDKERIGNNGANQTGQNAATNNNGQQQTQTQTTNNNGQQQTQTTNNHGQHQTK